MIELRDYQLDVLERSEKAERRDVRKQLWVLPTGAGKTVVFAELLRRRGGRGVIVAHRDELISQSVAKVMDSDPTLQPTLAAERAMYAIGRSDLASRTTGHARTVGIVKAEANDVTATVVVASVQTLRPARLAMLAEQTFATVVVDEAHRSRADSYGRVLAELRAGDVAGPLLVGVTATPDRGDGRGLDTVFDEVIAPHDMAWFIEQGYLSDLRAIEVPLVGFDEKALKVSGGDFTAGSSGAALEAANAPELIVQAWRREAATRKTIVFLPTVATAEATAEAFCEQGIAAAAVSADTDPRLRKAMLRDFTDGRVQVMVNVAVLSEGYDEPSVDCIVMARPTKSRALYAQCVGRASRRFPTKTDALILDMVGNSEKHSLVTLPSLFGVEADPRARKGELTVTEAIEAEKQRVAQLGATKKVTLFKPMPKAQVVWVTATDRKGGQYYVRPLGARKIKGEIVKLPTVVLAPATEEQWSVSLLFDNGKRRMLMDSVALELAQGIGEDYVRKNVAVQAFTRTDAPWRRERPSERAVAAAEKWRLTVDPSWNAGQLKDALDAHIARKKLAKADRLAKKGPT